MTSQAVRFQPRSRTFSRGVHPPECKELAAEGAVEVLPTPKTVRVPVLQHIGAPCEPAVKPRTEVEIGDLVASAGGFVSANCHASIRGKVARATMTTLPNGRHVSVVTIKAGKEQPTDDELRERFLFAECPTDLDGDIDGDAVRTAVHEAGLVGMGGAAFPTHVKLARNDDKPIDTLLVNGA